MKIKIKSLAAEAAIIRHDERTANHPDTRNSLHNHRVHIVRPEARAAQLAYAFLRQRNYAQIERPLSRPPDWANVRRICKRFGDRDVTEDELEAWATGSGTMPRSPDVTTSPSP